MTKEKFDEISSKMSDIKNVPNSDLVKIMDDLTTEFDIVKKRIIDMTYYIDKIELLYNNILKEFESRGL
jgi:hypothetical protein